MTTLFIEPSDVWLFRDGRPFSAGSDRRARSLFPPMPTVTAGMVRTSYLLHNKVDLLAFKAGTDAAAKADIGSPQAGDYGNLRLCGPFVAVWDGAGKLTRYYPAPADLFVRENTSGGNEPAVYLVPQVVNVAKEMATANWPGGLETSRLLWLPSRNDDDHKVDSVQGWLDEEQMRTYLAGKAEAIASIQLTRNVSLFDYENRLGIELQPGAKTTVEGMLYTVDFIRATWEDDKRIGISIEVKAKDDATDIASDWPVEGVVSLGGERRTGLYRKVEPRPATDAKELRTRSKLKVYFATPAYFNDGWLPASDTKLGQWGRFFSGNPRLVAAAVSTPLTMGGYDLASSSHKPAKRYVPAGSVYYLESADDSPLELKEDLINNAITDDGAEIGFGQVLIGEWR